MDFPVFILISEFTEKYGYTNHFKLKKNLRMTWLLNIWAYFERIFRWSKSILRSPNLCEQIFFLSEVYAIHMHDYSK